LVLIHWSLVRLLEGGASSRAGSTQTPQAVLIAPTRELAIQIKDEARRFSAGSALRAVVLYGGASLEHQARKVREGCNLLIATPGRLLDCVERGIVSFAKVGFLVLDEADKMLRMGFKGRCHEIFYAHSKLLCRLVLAICIAEIFLNFLDSAIYLYELFLCTVSYFLVPVPRYLYY
jgi:superfamily II DNA/RNA helicase